MKIERERDALTGKFSSFFGLKLTKVRHGESCNIKLQIDFPGGKIVAPRVQVNPRDILIDAEDLDSVL